MGKNQGKKGQKSSGSSNNANCDDPVNEQWVNENLRLEPPDGQRNPYFAFRSQGNNRPEDGSMIASDIITLLYSIGRFPPFNILSFAMVMEIGMSIAYYESRPPNPAMLLNIQRAAWDCVIYLRQRLELAGVRGLETRTINLSGRIIAGIMHDQVRRLDQSNIPWNYFHELFLNILISIVHGRFGQTLPAVIAEGNRLYDTYYSIFQEDADFRGLYAADLHPIGSDPFSPLLRYNNNTVQVQDRLVLSPTANLLAPTVARTKRSSNDNVGKSSKRNKSNTGTTKNDSTNSGNAKEDSEYKDDEGNA